MSTLSDESLSRDTALLQILGWLRQREYVFVSPTPGTHRRIRQRPHDPRQGDLRDVFGWNRAFVLEVLEPELVALMQAADGLEALARDEAQEETFRFRYRVSSLEERLLLHSAPSSDPMAVFLGPDSYRFTRFVRQALGGCEDVQSALDIGTGAGVGALALAAQSRAAKVVGSDINPAALRLARINADHNGLAIDLIECSGLPVAPERFDVICANPPYVAGMLKRVYRDGGGDLGEGLALSWVTAGLTRLRPGGRFLLYTGSAIVGGRDPLRDALERLAQQGGCDLHYEEIDPDVFGGTLGEPAYAGVERIAAVGAVLTAT